jgi:glycosyltransferase involved in cell wall biosynthesis
MCISLRFNTFLVLFSILIRLRYKSENYIYWTRDINLALLLSLFSKNKVICEVHRTPIKIQLFILKILSRKKNVLLAPISNFLDNTSLYNKKRKIIAPMAVNSSDIEYFNKIRKKRRRNIIYVGNIESGGIKLDLSILISVAKLLKESNLDWSIEVVGISTTQAMQASKFKNLENLRFLGYLPRESVLQKLGSSRIGVVMYPNLPWFYDSFPIKIVEYSAAGLAIVASDTISHRRVLDEKRCLYFEANSAASLYGAILELTKNNVLEMELSNNSRIWASNFTYEKRVKLVINAVLNLGTKNN